MRSFLPLPQVRFLDFKHLLLVDLTSSGLLFYLAKDVKDLTSIDFTNLTLLKSVFTTEICQSNILSHAERLTKILNEHLRAFDLADYAVVFLISPDSSKMEQEYLKKAVPFLKKVFLVERCFFDNFYLMQKRNFSSIKFLVDVSADCAELSLFDQEKLLATETIALRNLAFRSKDFFLHAKSKFQFKQPDCFYFFTHHLNTTIKSLDLAKYLKLEAIEITNLC